jgi:hypothetical protein
MAGWRGPVSPWLLGFAAAGSAFAVHVVVGGLVVLSFSMFHSFHLRQFSLPA